jgi:hypothetical protein
MAGYSGTPLPKKLGIKSHTTLALVGAPTAFERTLGTLPSGVRIKRRAGPADLTIWFPKSAADLEKRIARIAELVGDDHVWIAWPKRASGVKSDVTSDRVRGAGLAHGLVDYKVAAIDNTWSGLKFTRRKRS